MRVIGAIIGLVIMGTFCFMVWRLVSSFIKAEKAGNEDDAQGIEMKETAPEKKDPKTGLDG